MCKDLTHDEQRHLVVFANNFGDVFGDRSTKGDAPPLDQHLAELFANMEVGGRIVTLHDLSPYYEGRNDWYRRDVFESGEDTGEHDIFILQFSELITMTMHWMQIDYFTPLLFQFF